MALWRRQLRAPVMVHSDQGCQFTGQEWQTFLRDHNLVSSMSRRGNCHDNAVAESFFQLLKRELIRRRVYATRDDARADVSNYNEMFYNSQRRHSSAAGLSPVELEQRHSQRLTSVLISRGDPVGLGQTLVRLRSSYGARQIKLSDFLLHFSQENRDVIYRGRRGK